MIAALKKNHKIVDQKSNSHLFGLYMCSFGKSWEASSR